MTSPQPPPNAPRSPDGKYWWNGANWQPIPNNVPPPPPPSAPLSPDGKYVWNGTAWVPLPAASAASSLVTMAKNKPGIVVSMGGSALALLGFFMPWYSIYFFNITGWNLLSLSSSLSNLGIGASGLSALLLWLLLGAIFTTFGLGAASFAGKGTKSLNSLQITAVGVALGIMLLIVANALQALPYVSIGIWATMLGLIGALLGSIIARREVAP